MNTKKIESLLASGELLSPATVEEPWLSLHKNMCEVDCLSVAFDLSLSLLMFLFIVFFDELKAVFKQKRHELG